MDDRRQTDPVPPAAAARGSAQDSALERVTDDPRGAAEEIKQAGREKVEEWKSIGRDSLDDAKGRANTQADKGASRMAGRLESIQHAVHAAAERLEQDGDANLAMYVRQAAQQLEKTRGYLDDQDGAAMLRDLEEQARTHPGTFLGTSFATGLLVGRMLRTSAPEGESAPEGTTMRTGTDLRADTGRA